MNTLFEKFSPVLCSANPPIVRDERLLIDRHGNVEVYYAPFEHTNPAAKVVLVGITPGPTQMANANYEARRAILAGKSDQEAMQLAKGHAAFSGKTLRGNLVSQLDHWGFQTWLGLRSTEELFGPARNLVHTTSLLRFPVFVGGKDYRGTPDMTTHLLLRQYLMMHFVKEVSEMKNALFVGLGPQVQRVLDYLVRQGALDGDRIVNGLLHPSGNCTYRIHYLVGDRRQPVPYATNPLPYDRGRAAFRAHHLAGHC